MLGIHLPQAFVALHADTLAARIIDGIKKAARPEHGRLGVFASEPGRGEVDFLQVRLTLVQPTRLERAEQRAVEQVYLRYAAHLTPEHIAFVAKPTAPAALGFVGLHVEAGRNTRGLGVGLLARQQ